MEANLHLLKARDCNVAYYGSWRVNGCLVCGNWVHVLDRVATLARVPAAVPGHVGSISAHGYGGDTNSVVVVQGGCVGSPFRKVNVLLVHLLGDAFAKDVGGGAHGHLAHG